MKPSFNYNENGVKSSVDQYRNINGIHFICWCWDNTIFDNIKLKAKNAGLKTRIIKGELYVEKRPEMTIEILSGLLEV